MIRRSVWADAPGKVILGGEHAVVYGKPAIAFAIDQGVRVTISTCNGAYAMMGHRVTSEKVQHAVQASNDTVESRITDLCGFMELPMACFVAIALELGLIEGCEAQTESSLFASGGLGSSAAYSVALCSALYAFKSQNLDMQEQSQALVQRLVNICETAFHGTPSGLDSFVSLHGGLIRFQRRDNTEFQRLESSVLSGLSFTIVDTQVPRKTIELVARVQGLDKELRSSVIDSIEGVVLHELDALDTIKNAELLRENLAGLMQRNQEMLEHLGVGHPVLVQVCAIASQRHVASKLIGAGGGGCALLLGTPAALNAVKDDLHKNGFPTLDVQIRQHGVQTGFES